MTAEDPGAAARLDAVVTHHLDGYRSGVARFNELLAERLGVPFHGLDALEGQLVCPLLSFKVRELSAADAARVERFVTRAPGRWEVFLHEYLDLPLERALVAGAQRVLCGNREIEERVADIGGRVETLWTPGLILDRRRFPTTELSIFSFGMAHKVQTRLFRRLRDLLEASGRTYALFVSAANHETASLRDAEVVFEEMHELFPERLYFLGNLSDVAVSNQLRSATYFAAFFPAGLRANNTSVASAMEHGSVVLTNLDEHSPLEFRHLENVVDLTRCDTLPTDPDVLGRIGATAAETARMRSWDALVERIR